VRGSGAKRTGLVAGLAVFFVKNIAERQLTGCDEVQFQDSQKEAALLFHCRSRSAGNG